MTELLWERWHGEPLLWFDRFDTFYRPFPETSLLGAYNRWRDQRGQHPSKGVSQAWHRAFRTWEWKRRWEAWKEEERLKRHTLEQDAVMEMNEEHITLARSMWLMGSRSLEARLTEQPVRPLSDTEMRQFIKVGVELERQARGLPTWMVELAAMSDEELLREYRDALEATAGQVEGAEPPWSDRLGPDDADDDGDDGEVPEVPGGVQA